MSSQALIFRRALALLLAGGTISGCHARWFPLGSAPPYHFRAKSTDGELQKKMTGTLTDDDDQYAMGFKYEVPAPGSLLITFRPAIASVSLDVDVFADGSVPIATTKDAPDKKLQVQDVGAGPVFVVVRESWKDAQKTKFTLTTIFKPQDPDGANGPYKSQAGARELPADKGSVSDTVDYSQQRRTNFWKVSLPGEGGLNIKFNPNGAKITATVIGPAGAPEAIDPTVGYNKPDLAAGDYFVKVEAVDAGDQGKYELTTAFKAGDTCKNGGPACSLEGAEDLKLPSDNKTADVDFTKSKQFHYYKATLKERGRLTIAFKILQPPRGSKVGAFLMKQPDDEGDKISGSSATRELDPGEYWIRVQAPDAGDFGKYALQTIFQPNNFVAADVVEYPGTGGGGCIMTVSAGTNQGVRAGAACTLVNQSSQPIDSCVVDSVFANLAKVRPMAPGCRVPRQGVKVQIAAQ